MPNNQHNDDLAATAIHMIIGAGESIALKARYVDGREFGLRLEDFVNSVDNRLSLRCLLPLKVDGLVVAGRCISGTYKAQASYWAMPIYMATGHAVGVCAAFAARHGKSSHALSATEIQGELVRQGVNLGYNLLPHPIFHPEKST